MDETAPIRITSVMGVTRALLATVGVDEAVHVLTAEFGWDATFQALSLMRGEDAEQAFALTWQQLLTDPFERDLRYRDRV